ncbi:MAG: alanine racemase [Lachnospiraceae bacterium]|nr:alanine racemase [Lachnospiraceae bacterium]
MKEYYRVQANINLDSICNNIKNARALIAEGTQIMAIIKADGYGHGAVPIAKVLEPYVEAYGIAIIEEGIELRKAGISKPILILGYTPRQQCKQLIQYNIMPTVFSYEMAKQISKEAVKQNKKIKIHIKLDTGMSRIGFPIEERSIEIIKNISQLPCIEIEGCFSHFAKADEADKSFTYVQLEKYLNFVDVLEKEGIHISTKHISNSAAIMEIPKANLNMVRSGISTYGLYPSKEVDTSKQLLEPAMEIKACVSFVKELEAGIGIGYGSTFVTERKTKVATIPVGYADGYPRALSSKGRVLLHGKFAPILGRICMDQFMVDVTEIPDVKEGDIVTLVGKDGNERITVEELADEANSFNYEFVCDVGKRIPRVYFYHGKKVGTMDFYSYNPTEFQWE